MKQSSLKVTSILVTMVILLAACSSPGAIVGQAISNSVARLNVAGSSPIVAQASAPTETPSASTTNGTATGTTSTTNFSELLTAYQGVLEDIYVRVNPSVVNIHVVETTPVLQNPRSRNPNNPGTPGGSGQPYQEGLGSGFIWDLQGHIVTNNHVVSGASTIEVIFSNGTILPAKLVGADANSDLAVIKVEASASLLKPITVADSRLVKVGQLAIAIGNPFGLSGTMTNGIVSAIGRSLPASDTSSGSSTAGIEHRSATYSIPDVIQTDAPINPGNSGGVLVNDQGQLIGVTAAIESSSQSNSGIGFAIPSAIVQKVVPALIKVGQYAHPYLGMSGMELTPDLAQAMNLKSDQRGALVETVVANGPAAKAGLLGSTREVTINGQTIQVGGDVIVSIDNQPISGMDDLIAYLESSTSVGQKVTLNVLRDGKEVSLPVTLGARPVQ
jgi:serine protease Do